MQTPVEISFRNLDPSDFIEARVRERVDRLDQLSDRITSVHVTIEAPHKHHQKGNKFEVKLEVRLPGTELLVNNKPGDVNAHEDVYVAIRDAFGAMERRIRKWKTARKEQPKIVDSGAVQGRVSELNADDGHGQIATTSGELVYFHRNAVVGNGFPLLGVDDPVELVIDHDGGEKGPHATMVRPIRPMQFADQPKPSR